MKSFQSLLLSLVILELIFFSFCFSFTIHRNKFFSKNIIRNPKARERYFSNQSNSFDSNIDIPIFSENFADTNVSYVNVYDFGAKGDGVTDNTPFFQKALDAMGVQASGGIVFVPRGLFRFDGSLNVPNGVTLEGTYKSVPSHAVGFNSHDAPNIGSVLLPYGGRNNENGTPFITLNENTVLRGFTIYYPQQVPNQRPVPYPWSVTMVGDNPAVFDLECLNCFNAIRAVGAGRHYIARVQGQPINIGVYIDQTYDIGRVENVHFNPWFSSNKVFMDWQLTYGRSFVIARSDWEYVFNTFSFGYAIGYHFIASKDGSCNGNFLGIGADMAANASILVEAADPWGILITNGEFTSFVDSNFGVQKADSTQVIVTGSNSGSVRFVNSAFWGPSNQIAIVQGSGTVAFSNCIFNYWDAKNKGNYALNFGGTGSVSVSGCDFQHSGNQISVASSVKRAVIVGNIINGPERIVNGGVVAFEKGLNAAA